MTYTDREAELTHQVADLHLQACKSRLEVRQLADKLALALHALHHDAVDVTDEYLRHSVQDLHSLAAKMVA